MPCPKGAQIGMASERLEQSSFVINEICRERHPIGFRHIEDSTILNKIFASMENVLFAALNPNVCAHTHHMYTQNSILLRHVVRIGMSVGCV